MEKYLKRCYFKHQLMRVEDFVKQIRQGVCGPTCIGSQSFAYLLDEAKSLGGANDCLFEQISHDMVRVNIGEYVSRGYPLETLFRFFQNSATEFDGQKLDDQLATFVALVGSGEIDLPRYQTEKYVRNFKENGYPVVNHSMSYRLNYQPHYRVIKRQFAEILPVVAQIDRLAKGGNVLFAIDGFSNDEINLLADKVQKYYQDGCRIIALDSVCPNFCNGTDSSDKSLQSVSDFLHGVLLQKPFQYRAFDGEKSVEITFHPAPIVLIAGVGSLSDKLQVYYDGGVVCTSYVNEKKLCNANLYFAKYDKVQTDLFD